MAIASTRNQTTIFLPRWICTRHWLWDTRGVTSGWYSSRWRRLPDFVSQSLGRKNYPQTRTRWYLNNHSLTQPPRMNGTLNISVLPIIHSSRRITHTTRVYGAGTMSPIKLFCWYGTCASRLWNIMRFFGILDVSGHIGLVVGVRFWTGYRYLTLLSRIVYLRCPDLAWRETFYG